jgi:NAD(P)H-hydrate epimerase
MLSSHPILTCEQAQELESRLFKGDEALEWNAMSRAGAALADAVLADFRELGGFPAKGRILVLAGKGHNAGDALIAAESVLRRHPEAGADILFAFGERSLRPLASRAWRHLAETARERISLLFPGRLPEARRYAICLDGVFGFQFKPPLDEQTTSILAWATRQSVALRAAVDLPSGLALPGAFAADFTYATGSFKLPLLSAPNAGRLRYLDLGFFEQGDDFADVRKRVLCPGVLARLRALRPAYSDKRSYGHLFLLGGSRQYPGAVLMATLAALKSGAGLVTVFVPESLVPSFAAQAPEAIWVGWPETPEGGLALEGEHLLQERLDKASALALGPGMGRDPETLALVESVAKRSALPLVIDADALQASLIDLGSAPRILTPHAGEFQRIAKGATLADFSTEHRATVVLKGPVTRIAQDGVIYHSLAGGPVLARGGSGDLLCGLTGGLLAQTPEDPLGAAACGVVWHGRAADLLARSRGQVSVRTTQLLDYLPEALKADIDG